MRENVCLFENLSIGNWEGKRTEKRSLISLFMCVHVSVCMFFLG
jgi:hypothetical protein